MCLEVMRDHAGALIGSRRATIWIGWRGKHDNPPIGHGTQLRGQKLGLRSGFIGMWHRPQRLLRISRYIAELEINPGRQNKFVIGKCRTVAQAYDFFVGIDSYNKLAHHRHAKAFKATVIMHKGFKGAQTAKIEIGKKTGCILLFRLNNRHVNFGRATAQNMGQRSATWPPANDNDLGARATINLRQGLPRSAAQRCRC